MLRFSLLGSGSAGNAALVRSETTTLLLDCGLSLKKLHERATLLGAMLDAVDAVLVTHEHGDHVSSLGAYCRRFQKPVHLSFGTLDALPQNGSTAADMRPFESGDTWHVGDIEISSFSVSHDAADPVGYTFRCRGAKLGFATDVGSPNALLRTRLAGAHALVLEANYCPELLRNGSYPLQIQQRIRSRIGHLSNHDMAALLDDLLHDALQTVVLVHISENNNAPDLAKQYARGVLDKRKHPARLFDAPRDAATPWIEINLMHDDATALLPIDYSD